MGKNMKTIRTWIQDRRDRRFLRQLERVLNNYVVKASPKFAGNVKCREQQCVNLD